MSLKDSNRFPQPIISNLDNLIAPHFENRLEQKAIQAKTKEHREIFDFPFQLKHVARGIRRINVTTKELFAFHESK